MTVDIFMNIMTLKIALPLKVNGKNSLRKCDFQLKKNYCDVNGFTDCT